MTNIRLWIVEDNSADAFLIDLALRRTDHSFEKTMITDGENALRTIRACQAGSIPVPDILLLDLNLPRFDGLEILRILRAIPLFENTGIAVFSSSSVRVEEFGVKLQLQKPADLEEFLHKVSRAVLELIPKNTRARPEEAS